MEAKKESKAGGDQNPKNRAESHWKNTPRRLGGGGAGWQTARFLGQRLSAWLLAWLWKKE